MGDGEVVEPLLCPRTIGRGAETEWLLRCVEGAAAGSGRATVVLGDAGMGKSRLTRTATAHARARGVRVLPGRVRDGAVGVPYAVFGEALAAGFRDGGWPAAAALRPVRAQLGHLAGEAVPAPRGGMSRLAVAEALLRLLTVLARDGGALLVVEDLHWADEDTIWVLEYLLSTTADHDAACLVTLRPDRPDRPDHPGRALSVVRRLADTRAAHLLELAPLSDTEVDRMVLACLGEDATADGLLTFVREHADGVPYVVEELLAGLRRAAALLPRDGTWRVVEDRLAAAVPATVAELVTQRTAGLRPRTRQVVSVAALLGRVFDWQLLARVVGTGEDAVLACLREAADAQLVEPDEGSGALRFRHALTRDFVAARLLPPERATLAATALGVVAAERPDLPGEWCSLAAELAELAGDAGAAARHLTELGRRARGRGGLATAAAHFTRALRCLDRAGEDSLPVREELAAAHALAGEVEPALDLGRPALAERQARGDDPARESALRIALARALYTAGRWDAAGAELDRVRPSAAPEARLEATALRAHVVMARGDPSAAAALAREVLDPAATGRSPATACEAWEALGQTQRLHDVAAAERSFTAALAEAERHGLDDWRVRSLHELGTIDLLDTMRTDRLEAARRAAVRAGMPATVVVVDFHLAEALVARGHDAAGRQAAERAAAVARRLRSSVLAPALITLARSYAHELRETDMERALGEAARSAPDDPAVAAGAWGRARVMLALHRADPAAARAALDRAVEVLRTLPGHHFPHWGLWALLHALDDGDPDGRTLAEAAAAAGSDTRFNRCLTDAARAVRTGADDPVAAQACFDAAIEELRGYLDADWLVHLVRWLVAPAAARDRWGDPADWLRVAVRWFADHDRPLLASAARTLLRDAGEQVPRRGRGRSAVPPRLLAVGVSSREVDVLRLLAEPRSNRAIAERLVLSPRTVEKHVASLLQKTGAPDRDGLTALARELTFGSRVPPAR
ncbi:helix-turn-helix transcriptional regulator [Pseudonocardia sp. RS010]|uniref:helix-turn-helix transcriptional regulator n=1 Tax=Pseudonocardia sp. RS010 TaxID=3385979 RepID=UPI0039A19DBA